MRAVHVFAHLIFPRESNNQKAKVLHPSSLTFIIIGILLYQFSLTLLPTVGVKVLGYAARISPAEVIRLTNERREESGLGPLILNTQLSNAALAKGTDMLNKDYWAHIAPDGTQPWKFFTDFGYQYRYAGENLARDFSDPDSTVNAWMNSPSHKENLLSPKYKEIGIAVVEGDFNGVDTTLIVQLFGTRLGETAVIAPVAAYNEEKVAQQPQIDLTLSKGVKDHKALISPFDNTRGFSLAIVVILLGVLVVDGIVVSSRNIARVSGRSFAHLSYLGMVLAILIIIKAGQIL